MVSKREPLQMVVQRRRREFNQAFRLGDKDAHELWNSSQMECRPFKDPNFELRRQEQERGVQAVPETVSVASQASGGRPKPAACQTTPQDLPGEAKQQLLAGEGLTFFMDRVMYRCV